MPSCHSISTLSLQWWRPNQNLDKGQWLIVVVLTECGAQWEEVVWWQAMGEGERSGYMRAGLRAGTVGVEQEAPNKATCSFFLLKSCFCRWYYSYSIGEEEWRMPIWCNGKDRDHYINFWFTWLPFCATRLISNFQPTQRQLLYCLSGSLQTPPLTTSTTTLGQQGSLWWIVAMMWWHRTFVTMATVAGIIITVLAMAMTNTRLRTAFETVQTLQQAVVVGEALYLLLVLEYKVSKPVKVFPTSPSMCVESISPGQKHRTLWECPIPYSDVLMESLAIEISANQK